MRILIISDIHANPWALAAVERDAGPVDRILCAGDTVSYGPDPKAVVNWLRMHKVPTVRGNHDHAVAFDDDPRASPAKRPLALAMKQWTRQQLDDAQSAWLMSLPRQLPHEIDGSRFLMVHATPLDPFYDYRLTPDVDPKLLTEMLADVEADVLVVGHTHRPLLMHHGKKRIVNPGSVGQPLDGDRRAAYAVWEDGRIRLCRAEYDQEPVLAALARLPLPAAIVSELSQTLQRALPV